MGKQHRDMLEIMNIHIAERMSFVGDYIRSFEVDRECRQHILPVYTPDPTYEALRLDEISGVIVFLFGLLVVSIVILLLEILSVKWKNVANGTDFKEVPTSFALHENIDERFEFHKRRRILEKHLELLEEIERD
jgi:hypothetical protein